MLHKTFVVLAGLGLAISVMGTGCAKPTTEAPAVQPQAQHQHQQDSAQTDEHRQIAPLVVKLVPVSENSATGEVELRADFDVREPITYPLSLTLVAPEGALVLAGAQTETLAATPAGRFSKTYKVRTQAPLSQQSFVKLVVHGQSANNAMGLHAEPRFPAVIETGVPPRQGPSIPGGRPPMPARK